MSMYHMVNGVKPSTFFILPVLGKHPDWYPRFRDCFTFDPERPETTAGKIIVYTRTGGGNREYHEDDNSDIKAIDGFLFDYDDPDDTTYACWVFDVPEKWKTDIDKVLTGQLANTSKEYQDLILNMFPKIADKIRPVFQAPPDDKK